MTANSQNKTNELHAAIAKMQVLMTQAADRLAHYADSLAESHTKDGIVQDVAVQLILESEADLIDELRAAALPWDQRHKSTERPPSRAHQFPAESVEAVRADLQGALQAHGLAPKNSESFTQTFEGLPMRKLKMLLTAGWAINGVSIERTGEDGTTVRCAVTTGGMVLWWNRASDMISMSKEDAKSVMKALDDFDGWADHGCPPSTEVAVKIMRGAMTEREPTDSMGMPLSCGKPLCAPGDHHPLCKLATPLAQPAPVQEQALPEFFAALEYNSPDWDVFACVYRRRADATPELVHREQLPRQAPASTAAHAPWNPSKEQFTAWCKRHGMQPSDRDAFNDAATLYQLSFASLATPPTAQPAPAPTSFDVEFLSKRLARVAKLAGVTMPDMTHEQIAGLAGTILGDIARKLEAAPVQEVAATITITQRGSIRTIDNHFSDCVKDWPDGEYKLVLAAAPEKGETS